MDLYGWLWYLIERHIHLCFFKRHPVDQRLKQLGYLTNMLPSSIIRWACPYTIFTCPPASFLLTPVGDLRHWLIFTDPTYQVTWDQGSYPLCSDPVDMFAVTIPWICKLSLRPKMCSLIDRCLLPAKYPQYIFLCPWSIFCGPQSSKGFINSPVNPYSFNIHVFSNHCPKHWVHSHEGKVFCPPVLLRYKGTLKVYSVRIWYMYMLWNYCHNKIRW